MSRVTPTLSVRNRIDVGGRESVTTLIQPSEERPMKMDIREAYSPSSSLYPPTGLVSGGSRSEREKKKKKKKKAAALPTAFAHLGVSRERLACFCDGVIFE